MTERSSSVGNDALRVTVLDNSAREDFADFHRSQGGSAQLAPHWGEGLSKHSLIVGAYVGNRLVGTQAYNYWPYRVASTNFYAVQSGASLVDRTVRGRGIFHAMLRFGERALLERGVDFAIGVPNPASYPRFMKDQWTHLGSLRWFVRPVRPTRLLLERTGRIPTARSRWTGEWRELQAELPFAKEMIRLSTDDEYQRFRYLGRESEFVRTSIAAAKNSFDVICKPNTEHGFAELTVGQVLSSHPPSWGDLREALSRIVELARDDGDVDAVTMLVNPLWTPLVAAAVSVGFLPVHKTVPFILKPLKSTAINALAWRDWAISCGDLDTW
jgi:hypothetical protein